VDAAEGVLVNDSDADGDVILAQLVAGTTEGNLTLNPDGSFVYEPVAGYTGADHFVYQANDGLATSLPVMVTINVIEGLDLYLPVAIK
jgi:VCBS repeat-containing protein